MHRLITTTLILLLSAPAFAGDTKTVTATPAATAATAAKTTGLGTTAVKTANEKIAGLLKQKPAAGSKEEKDLAAKVTTSVRDFLDIDELGKRAMADQWAKLKPEQQQEFLSTLRALIEFNYVRGLRSNLSYTVDYAGESTDKDGNTLVTTVVNTKRKGRPFKIHVDYVLKKQGDKLRAWDVVTDGSGLVENYKQMFNKIISKDGFDGLISRMKKKQSEAS